jgi:hypothetical protein
MFLQSKSAFFSIAAIFAISFSPLTFNIKDLTTKTEEVSERTLSTLVATKTSPSSVNLSWDAWAGTDAYTVTVKNLTTNTTVQSFNTFSTTANINNLSLATDSYRFTVTKAGFVIIVDVAP